MELIEGVVRHYDWGSLTAIPELLGRPATGEPWAEFWLGAHPAAPAKVGARAEPLDRLIAADPVAALGPAVASRYGRLPFLLKVLAAAEPLSLQAHPSAAHAEAGFEREEAEGIPRDGPRRMFRDRSAKPELVCALSPFEALCGFRDPQRTAALLDTLEAPGLDPLRRRLGACRGSGLSPLLRWLLTMAPDAAAALAECVAGACASASGGDEWSRARSALAELGTRYPGDRGVAVALLLNHVVLAPGEALPVPPGRLHVYLGGVAVEVMACSDNVVRGGLTVKHVDAAALLEVADPVPDPAAVHAPEPVGGVATYITGAPEFSLRRLDVRGSASVGGGPAILLCVEGRADIDGATLGRGAAAWIGGGASQVELSGRAAVYRVGVGSEGSR